MMRENASHPILSKFINASIRELIYKTLSQVSFSNKLFRFFQFQYSGIRIGPVVKRDVMKASTMLEHENQ